MREATAVVEPELEIEEESAQGFVRSESSDPASFIPFLKAVGRGAKLRRDLSYAEATQAIRLIVRRAATPAQIGGFLIGQRVKGEAAEEIRGFTDAMRTEVVRQIFPRVENLLDLGVPYDGKVKTAQLAPAVAILLAACGVPVVLHGDEGIPTKEGITPGMIFRVWGVPTDLEPNDVERMIEKTGVGYLAAAKFAPAWHALTSLRRELGLRTALNSAEKLFNPANAPYQIVGFFHGEYLERMRVVTTGTRASWIVQGEEGSIEMAAGRATHIFATDESKDWILAPASVGFSDRVRIALPPDAKAHAELNASVIAGNPGAGADQAALTAGAILALLGAAADLREGVERARRVLTSGAAQRRLESVRSFR